VIKSLYLNRIFYYCGFSAAGLFVISYFLPPLFTVALLLGACTLIAVVVDVVLLFSQRRALTATRFMQPRLSNGDDNKVVLSIKNAYGFKIATSIIDELPFQFQDRTWKRHASILAGEAHELAYWLQPRERGSYEFGHINVFVRSPLGIVSRHYICGEPQTVKVYPSYLQMRRFQLSGVASPLTGGGTKRMRKLGHSLEFEQIKEYVPGDDYRTINWKATARHGYLMTNNYTDERSQQIYCIVNKGRIMKMPFDGLSLLDYSINAAVVLSNVALQKQDRAGLITFAQNVDTFIPADKKGSQLNVILESLYRQSTNFMENDFEKLFSVIRNRITHRSLLVLFTNFESLETLKRELPYLKKIAHYHLLMVVFFENTELRSLIQQPAATIEDIYVKTIAEKYNLEKRAMAKELRQHGIIAVLTAPQHLTINAINKYLELKSKQSI